MYINLPPLLRTQPVMFLLLSSVKFINEVTDDFNYGTDPNQLYDMYDFIVGKKNIQFYKKYGKFKI